jgi:hypothetical protein
MQDAFKELHDSRNKQDEHGLEGDGHDETTDVKKRNKHDDGQQQRWNIRKSIRLFWRSDRSVGDEGESVK